MNMVIKKEMVLSLVAALLIPSMLMITAVSNVYKGLWNLPFLICTVCGILTTCFGYLLGRSAKKSGKKTLRVKQVAIVVLGAIILTVCVAVVVSLNMSSIAFIVLPLAEFLWYLFGCKLGLELDILSNTVLGVICLEAAFLFPMCQSFDESGAAGSAVLIIFGAEIIICSLLLNMRHLKKVAIRGNAVSKISANTVRFNKKIALLFAMIIVSFFVISRFGGTALWEGLKALIRFLLSLIKEPERIDVQVENDLPKFEQLGAEGNSPFWFILVLVIVVVALLFLIKPIREAISELLNKLGKRLDSISGKPRQELTYTDFYESTVLEKQTHKRKDVKRAYKAFLKEKELDRKYRLGYKAFIISLGELGEDNLPSDTAQIYRQKEENTVNSGFARDITMQYEDLRYNDGEITENDCVQMDKMLVQLIRKK